MVGKIELSVHRSKSIEMEVKKGLVPKIENSINNNLFSVLQLSEMLDFPYNKNKIESREAYEEIINNSLFSTPNKEVYKVQFNGWADSIHAGILDRSENNREFILCTKFSLYLDVDENDEIVPFMLDSYTTFNVSEYSADGVDEEILDQRFYNFWEALYTIDGNYLTINENPTTCQRRVSETSVLL